MDCVFRDQDRIKICFKTWGFTTNSSDSVFKVLKVIQSTWLPIDYMELFIIWPWATSDKLKFLFKYVSFITVTNLYQAHLSMIECQWDIIINFAGYT